MHTWRVDDVMTRRAVVIGVGNPCRRDDGFGPVVVSLLRDCRLPDVELAESDGELATLIKLWTGAALAVVVDALNTRQGRPGRIHRMSAHHPAMHHAPAAARSHGAELGDAVAPSRVRDRMPQRLLLFAVETADVRYGPGLSPAVAGAAINLAGEISALLHAQHWTGVK